MLAMRFDNDSPPPMFEPQAEAMPAAELRALQASRLRELIDRLLAADGLQAGRLRAAGVTSGADVSLDDLARLPTTAKQDLWDAYPFGLLAVPRDRVVAVHGSSGTGGRPTLVAYTQERHRAVVQDVRPGARRGRRRARHARPQRVWLRPVHRRARDPSGRDRAGRDRRPGLRRHDGAPGHADRGPAPADPDLHAVVRDPAGGGAGRSWPDEGERAVVAGRRFRRRAVDR